jgi:tRNA pseudouridine13 synthase
LNKRLNNIKLGDFCYKKDKLALADSIGNHFKIAIREVKGDSKNIADALESLKANGFINYFGLQRFGTRSISTDTVGIAMLANNWAKACELILTANDIGIFAITRKG